MKYHHALTTFWSRSTQVYCVQFMATVINHATQCMIPYRQSDIMHCSVFRSTSTLLYCTRHPCAAIRRECSPLLVPPQADWCTTALMELVLL